MNMTSKNFPLSLLLIFSMLIFAAFGAAPRPRRARARHRQPAHREAALRARIHAFLNRTMGWQKFDQMKIVSISPPVHGLRTVKVHLVKGTEKGNQTLYITADGQEVVEGKIRPLSGDPWAKVRRKLRTAGYPSEGPVSAPVTIVEFSDLECPFCKRAFQAIQQMQAQIPGKARVIFKFFPLTKIHPWSMQAALAGACVARTGNSDFWAFASTVFQNQDDLTPQNAAERLRDFALDSGLNGNAYDACLKDPATRALVQASIANGNLVHVTSTPTLFVDGRTIDGAIPETVLADVVRHEANLAPKYDHPFALGAPHGAQCGLCGSLPPLPPKKERNKR